MNDEPNLDRPRDPSQIISEFMQDQISSTSPEERKIPRYISESNNQEIIQQFLAEQEVLFWYLDKHKIEEDISFDAHSYRVRLFALIDELSFITLKDIRAIAINTYEILDYFYILDAGEGVDSETIAQYYPKKIISKDQVEDVRKGVIKQILENNLAELINIFGKDNLIIQKLMQTYNLEYSIDENPLLRIKKEITPLGANSKRLMIYVKSYLSQQFLNVWIDEHNFSLEHLDKLVELYHIHPKIAPRLKNFVYVEKVLEAYQNFGLLSHFQLIIDKGSFYDPNEDKLWRLSEKEFIYLAEAIKQIAKGESTDEADKIAFNEIFPDLKHINYSRRSNIPSLLQKALGQNDDDFFSSYIRIQNAVIVNRNPSTPKRIYDLIQKKENLIGIITNDDYFSSLNNPLLTDISMITRILDLRAKGNSPRDLVTQIPQLKSPKLGYALDEIIEYILKKPDSKEQ